MLILVPMILAAGACGSDGDPSAESEAAPSGSNAEAAPSASNAETEAPPASEGGGATLTLANGETIEFASVLSALEPQMAAGSEILFTVTSYDDPGLDITQFGDEGTITGVASISVYDGDYETLWEANSMFGSEVELSLDGSTIRGTGSFLEGGDISNEAVDGEVVANC